MTVLIRATTSRTPAVQLEEHAAQQTGQCMWQNATKQVTAQDARGHVCGGQWEEIHEEGTRNLDSITVKLCSVNSMKSVIMNELETRSKHMQHR